MRILSIDLETLGREPGCCVLSIGWACVDTDSGLVVCSGISYPNLQEQLDTGMHVDMDTLYWWMARAPEAKQTTFVKPSVMTNVTESLELLNDAYSSNDCSFVTGYGSTFDVSIIEHAYKIFDVEPTWSYREVLCLRTMCLVTGTVVDRRDTVHHNAEADARRQAEVFLECHSKLARLQG